MLRSKENGKVVNDSRTITSVLKTLDCADNYDEYMSLAMLKEPKAMSMLSTEVVFWY